MPRAKFSRIPDSTCQNFLRFRNPDSLKDTGRNRSRLKTTQWRIQERGPGDPPPLISIISSPNWGPNSWKKIFSRPPPPLFEGPPLPFTVYSHFSVSLVCQKQAVHPGLVDVQALLGQKTTSQPTREFKTANRQWHFHLKYRYPNHRHSRFC